MKIVDARNLIDNALKADASTANTAMRGLSKNYQYRMPEVLARVVFEKVADYKNYLGDTDRFDVLVRLANLAVWTNTASEHKALLEKLLIVGLQHPSGKVRQNARRINENYQRFLSKEPEPIEFLHKLEKLIKKYEPDNIPSYVDKLKPSIYKSVVLTWHDTMAHHHLWEKLNYLGRMAELDIPSYSDLQDDEDNAPDEEYYTREDWKDYLEDFIVCDNWKLARELLAGQEKLSISLLKQALNENAVDDKYRKLIIQIARSSNPSRLADEVLVEVVGDIWARNEEPREEFVRRSSSIARAIQSMDNNAVILTANGHSFSRMISCAALTEAWRAKREFIELIPLLEGFAASHLAADEVITKLLVPADRKMINFYKEHNVNLPPPTDFITPRQVVHYILDWLMQINYQLFFRKTPNQLAAVAWLILDRRNPGLTLYGLENRSLAIFGGWSTPSGLSQLSRSLDIDLEQNMADPLILTINSLDDL